jgi:hypothetical protein
VGSGVIELFTRDEAGNILQLTASGGIRAESLAGEIADARLSANVPLLDATNTFTGQVQIGVDLLISGTSARQRFVETDAGVDETVWLTVVSTGRMFYALAADATPTTVAAAYFDINRTGTVIDSIAISATTLDFNGNMDVSGTSTFGANLRGANEAAGDPTYSFTNDTDSGLFLSADGQVGISAAGTMRAMFSAAEIDLTATALDFNGAVDVDGTVHDINGSTSVTLRGTANAVLALTTSGHNIDGSIDSDGAVLDFNGSTSVTLTGTANAVLALTTSGISATGALTTPNTSASEVGTKGAPSRDVTATDNTAATDAGGTIRFTGGTAQTFTLDSDPPEDTVLVLDNAGGAAWTIAASGTLIWANTAATGSRTLADDGLAVALHRGSGIWIINGGGLS